MFLQAYYNTEDQVFTYPVSYAFLIISAVLTASFQSYHMYRIVTV